MILPHYKKKVRIIDIDGTVLTKMEPAHYQDAQALPFAVETVNDWYKNGDYIVFWTARLSQYRTQTVKQLDDMGFDYHELLMDKPYCHGIEIYDDNEIKTHHVTANEGVGMYVASQKREEPSYTVEGVLQPCEDLGLKIIKCPKCKGTDHKFIQWDDNWDRCYCNTNKCGNTWLESRS